jgi:cysteine desulfuration protein SufE
MSNALPARLHEIIEEFAICDGEEKLELLLEYADKLPPLPERLRDLRDSMDQVHECMTPVFLHAEMEGDGMLLYFDVPPEAPTVRGYASILSHGLQGTPPKQILDIPFRFYEQMGIQHVIGPQRLNGISAMFAYVKRLAFQQAQQQTAEE